MHVDAEARIESRRVNRGHQPLSHGQESGGIAPAPNLRALPGDPGCQALLGTSLRRIGTIRGASWKDVEVKHELFDTTDRNAAIFMAPAVARRYGNPALFAAEAMILRRYRHAFTGKRVLDLAVGSGRTTRYLAALASNYLGIDVSRRCWLWRVPAIGRRASSTWTCARSASFNRRASISSSGRGTSSVRFRMMSACSSSVACTGYFRLAGSSLSPRIIAIGNMPADIQCRSRCGRETSLTRCIR